MEARFLDGERLTTTQIVNEFIKASNTINYMLGRDSVRSWLSTLKRRFWVAHHVWFGCLNDLGQYGICETEAEYRYSLTRYFSFIKGNIIRAVALKGEAQNKGLLLSEFQNKSFLLPAPVEKKKS